MWTTPKRLWIDKDGKPTDKQADGVVLLSGEWDRVELSLEDAKRLGLTGKPAKHEAPVKEGDK